MLSPCLASVTTDEIDPVTTDGIASVTKPVVEVVSKRTVGHSACRDNSNVYDWFVRIQCMMCMTYQLQFQ